MGGLFSSGGGSQNVQELNLPPWTAEVAFEYLLNAQNLAQQTYAEYAGWKYPWENYDPHGGVTYASRNPLLYVTNIVQPVGAVISLGEVISGSNSGAWANLETFIDMKNGQGYAIVKLGSNVPFVAGEVVWTYSGISATVVKFVPSNEIDGIKALSNRARYGVQVFDAQGNFLSNDFVGDGKTLLETIMRGDRIFANFNVDAFYDKQLEELIQEFDEVTIPDIDQDALMGGYYGGGSHNVLIRQAIKNLAIKMRKILYDIFYKDYQAGVSEIVNAFHHAVPLGNESIRDLELLRQAGLYDREYFQGAYADAYKAFKDAEDMNINKINILGNAVKALVGAQVSETRPLYRPSAMTSIAGIAMVGASAAMSLYKNTTKSPYELKLPESSQPVARQITFENVPKLETQDYGGPS